MDPSPAIKQFDQFIPLTTQQLTVALRQSGLSAQHMDVIHKLHQIISFEFYQKLRTLKKLYLPFDPDQQLANQSGLSAAGPGNRSPDRRAG